MDRNRSNYPNRGLKKASGHLGSEFYALGTKSGRDDCKSKSQTTMERKREATSTISNATKKAKLSMPVRPIEEATSGIPHELWEQMTTDCDVTELIDTIYSAIDQYDNEAVLRLLCGSIKQITTLYIRSKIDCLLYLALSYIAKMKPDFFCNDLVTSALVCVLRRESNIKGRQSSYSHILATNLLSRCYRDKPQWPDVFLLTYIDDAVNERIWVDNDMCTPFTETICSSFQTRKPTQSYVSESITLTASSGQPNRESSISIDDDSGDNSVYGLESSATMRISEIELRPDGTHIMQNRFSENRFVEKYVTDAIKEQLNKRQQQDCLTRNFLKFLCSSCGIEEVRFLCISRLELWIHNGKLVKFAQQLLSHICFNIKTKCLKDYEVLTILVKMRLKTKPLINFYMSCLKEMIILKPDILCVVLKLVVQNELSNTRNPNNMGMLATIFQTSPELSASHLAEIYKEFLLQRDDCLRTLRVFLRELARMLRFDVNLITFCKTFLNERPDLTKQIGQSEHKERIFHSMVDVTCLCMLLSVSPQVREAIMSLRTNRHVNSNPVLIMFYTQLSQIQLDAISWMYETVPNLFKLQSLDYNQALHKLLLLDSPEQYSRCDQWPSEPERAALLRIVSETPIHEETLLRIILIGITKDIPFTIPDTIDIIMLVIKRASAMRIPNCPAVQANKFDIIDFLFSMAEYHHPENITLPIDYDPPKLAIIVLYWKAWIILLMISCHNPSTFGAFCWDHYPTMKILIEMCITNQFNETNIVKDEMQILTMERDHILEFESYLAAQTSQAIITEDNAILISQLMLMDPMGPARKVPNFVLDQLKSLNKTFKLGHLLCRSRKPDLLLDIIQRQGTTQSMPWLSDLVQNSDADFNHLPVQCLCEFLLFNSKIINEENNRDGELVAYLRNILMDAEYNKQTVCEVFDYIFRRLTSTVKQTRIDALRGIQIIFKCLDMNENDWLLRSIPQIPHFIDIRTFIIPQLRSACQVENSPELVMSYIQFIAAHTLNDSVDDMLDHVIDMAQLIVERSTLFQHIIPISENSPLIGHESRFQTLKCLFVMFNNYIIKLREHNASAEWTEYPELLMVQFDDGMQLPLHLNIIHAFIILLTHASNTMPESIPILDYWFPPGRNAPTAYLPNMSQQPVQLLPDWLKLKMIRSSVDRLIDAALHELTPDQIVLFVQNFGTPVNSMSKLLALFDHAVIEQFDAVKSAILNKAYLAQLIEIQQARGAKNGHFTVQALGLHSHSQTIPDHPKHTNQVLELINLKQSLITPLVHGNTNWNNTEIEEIIHIILQPPHLNQLNYCIFRRLIHQLLARIGSGSKYCKDIQIDTTSKSIVYLVRLIERSKSLQMFQHVKQKHHVCTFFRVILSSNHTIINEYDSTIVILNETVHKLKEISESYYFDSSLVNIMQTKKQFRDKNSSFSDPKVSIKKENISNIYSQSVFFKPQGTDKRIENTNNILWRYGMLVDLIAEVDPELMIVSKQKQANFLFSKDCSNFRFYLLSLACHQTNWDSLITTLDFLLHQSQEHFDCGTVLNFIESLINNPKLWQGCDKSVSKMDQSDVILLLNKSQLNVFTQLILKEGKIEIENIPAKYDYKLCSRVELLFRLTNKKCSDLLEIIENVFNSSCSQTLRIKVLKQMYLMNPSMKFIKCKQTIEHSAKLQTLKGCQTDKVSNYLITCLGNLFLKKDFEMLSSDTELLLRKLAASHPALFLRQLGVLTSIIQGRAQINIRALRDEYHFHRFIQILRTLELLQPMLFDDAYKIEFQIALECYFTFLKHHSCIKEAYNILIKFVELLQTYINVNPTTALLFVEQYVGILTELAAKFSSIVSLHHLVQGIALLQHKTIPSTELAMDEFKQEFEIDEHLDPRSADNILTDMDTEPNMNISPVDINRGSVSFVISGSSNKAAVSPQFLNLIKTIRHSSAEEAILSPLQEIESLSSKRFSFLTELFDRLLELIFSPSAQIRSNAFILLIRHLKHNPGCSDINRCTLNAYIQCLRDDNSSVAATAVDNLAEITLLLQEHAVEILSVAFSLGIRSRLNTCIHIKRVLQTLMLQHGY